MEGGKEEGKQGRSNTLIGERACQIRNYTCHLSI